MIVILYACFFVANVIQIDSQQQFLSIEKECGVLAIYNAARLAGRSPNLPQMLTAFGKKPNIGLSAQDIIIELKTMNLNTRVAYISSDVVLANPNTIFIVLNAGTADVIGHCRTAFSANGEIFIDDPYAESEFQAVKEFPSCLSIAVWNPNVSPPTLRSQFWYVAVFLFFASLCGFTLNFYKVHRSKSHSTGRHSTYLD